jgi:hypothetical protein
MAGAAMEGKGGYRSAQYAQRSESLRLSLKRPGCNFQLSVFNIHCLVTSVLLDLDINDR